MKKLTISILTVLMVWAAFAFAEAEIIYRHMCHENHTGPMESVSIGTIAGWRAFSVFCDEGGYGEGQAVLDEITALNETYRDDKYLPRQAEFADIRDWLDTTHEIDDGSGTTGCSYCNTYHTMTVYETTRNAKVARASEIFAEIDSEWCTLADAIRAMVSDESYEAFIEAQ